MSESQDVEKKGAPLGDLFESYEGQYAQAWQLLMPKAEEMTLPILYLQRHTFELMIKELLLSALNERKDLHTLDEIFGTAAGSGPALESDFSLAYGEHKFKKLFPRLIENRKALGRSKLPSVLEELKNLFIGVDDDEPDRLRYETQRKNKVVHRSFNLPWEDDPKHAPCEAVAQLMGQLISERQDALERHINEQDAPKTEIGKFYLDEFECQQAMDGMVWSRFNPIRDATKEGQIRWRRVPKEHFRVGEHPTLGQYAGQVIDGLEAEYEGRTLALVNLSDMVRSRTGGSHPAYCFGARRPNGTLTEVVWPDEFQSNLVNEAVRQVEAAENSRS